MEEMSDMAALFATKVNPTGSPEISPVERLLNEFEAHEAKRKKVAGAVSEPAEQDAGILSRGFSCSSLSRMMKSIARSFTRWLRR